MNKVTGIILGAAAVTAGAFMVLLLIKKKKERRIAKLHTGQYTIDMFEKRLAKHDKLQKLYEQMEWKICNN